MHELEKLSHLVFADCLSCNRVINHNTSKLESERVSFNVKNGKIWTGVIETGPGWGLFYCNKPRFNINSNQKISVRIVEYNNPNNEIYNVTGVKNVKQVNYFYTLINRFHTKAL